MEMNEENGDTGRWEFVRWRKIYSNILQKSNNAEQIREEMYKKNYHEYKKK